MGIEEILRLFKVLRFEKPEPVTKPLMAVASTQPVVEIVAKNGTGNGKPEQSAKIEIARGRQGPEQQQQGGAGQQQADDQSGLHKGGKKCHPIAEQMKVLNGWQDRVEELLDHGLCSVRRGSVGLEY